MIHFIKPDLAWRRHDRLNITYYIIMSFPLIRLIEMEFAELEENVTFTYLHLVFGVLFTVINFYEIPVNRNYSVTLTKHLA